ncbi:MAG: hypothetical protein KAQ98_03945 [Bacteriovoracaceae bacterium]|nr:hypothetical protein [Bacteriovoracaceae bacterium]
MKLMSRYFTTVAILCLINVFIGANFAFASQKNETLEIVRYSLWHGGVIVQGKNINDIQTAMNDNTATTTPWPIELAIPVDEELESYKL